MERPLEEVLREIREAVMSDVPHSPGWYLSKGMELITLKHDLNDELIRWKTAYLARKMEFLLEHKSAEKAKICADATSEYENYYRCELRGEDVSEVIRLCKLRTQLRDGYDL